MKPWDLEAFRVEIAAPAENRLGESMDMEYTVFGKDERGKKGVFIDDDGAAAAEAPDEGNFVLLDFLEVEKRLQLAGDPHHNRTGRAPIEYADIES
jgi:hypothetical protein